jgi:hypothetical protein
MSNVRDVGLDVHKDSIVMSVAEPGNAEARLLGIFPNDMELHRSYERHSPRAGSAAGF